MTQKSENCSEQTAQLIDSEVGRIVNEQYDRAVEFLTKHKAELERVGEVLLEHETLSGKEIATILAGGEIERKVPDVIDASSEESEEKPSKRPSLFPPIRPVGKKDPDPEPA